MDQIARAAFIIAQAAIFNGRIAAMQAANLDRANRGMSPCYGEEEFLSVQVEFQHLEFNSALAYLRDG
jgi:hypothetical protein